MDYELEERAACMLSNTSWIGLRGSTTRSFFEGGLFIIWMFLTGGEFLPLTFL